MNLKYLGTYIVACISLFLFSCGNSKNEKPRNAFPITDTVAKDINPAIPQPVNLLDANCIWSIAYGGKKADNPHDIVSTADSGCIVLLWRTKNITKVDEVSEKREWQIVRFDKYGTIVWDKTLPTNEFGDYYTSIALFNDPVTITISLIPDATASSTTY